MNRKEIKQLKKMLETIENMAKKISTSEIHAIGGKVQIKGNTRMLLGTYAVITQGMLDLEGTKPEHIKKIVTLTANEYKKGVVGDECNIPAFDYINDLDLKVKENE